MLIGKNNHTFIQGFFLYLYHCVFYFTFYWEHFLHMYCCWLLKRLTRCCLLFLGGVRGFKRVYRQKMRRHSTTYEWHSETAYIFKWGVTGWTGDSVAVHDGILQWALDKDRYRESCLQLPLFLQLVLTNAFSLPLYLAPLPPASFLT